MNATLSHSDQSQDIYGGGDDDEAGFLIIIDPDVGKALQPKLQLKAGRGTASSALESTLEQDLSKIPLF